MKKKIQKYISRVNNKSHSLIHMIEKFKKGCIFFKKNI